MRPDSVAVATRQRSSPISPAWKATVSATRPKERKTAGTARAMAVMVGPRLPYRRPAARVKPLGLGCPPDHAAYGAASPGGPGSPGPGGPPAVTRARGAIAGGRRAGGARQGAVHPEPLHTLSLGRWQGQPEGPAGRHRQQADR